MKTTDYLVISTSLNPDSNSRVLARHAHALLSAREESEWLDLQDLELPLCDGNSAYSHVNVARVTKKIEDAQCIIVATPIYNFDVNAALKNLIELTGHAWNDKLVGFLCAAGGKSSYMSVMAVANSLMLDFRTVIIPRFVYADGSAFKDGQIDDSIKTRIEELTDAATKLLGRVKATA
jgi:FMN reductase